MFISYETCFVFLMRFIVLLLLLFLCFSTPAKVREAITLRCEWRPAEGWEMFLFIFNFRCKTMLWCINVFYALSNRAQIESKCWTVAQSVVPCAYRPCTNLFSLGFFIFWRWDVPFELTCMSCWNSIKQVWYCRGLNFSRVWIVLQSNEVKTQKHFNECLSQCFRSSNSFKY